MSEDFDLLKHMKEAPSSCDCHWCEVGRRTQPPFFGYEDRLSTLVKEEILIYRELYMKHFDKCVEARKLKTTKPVRTSELKALKEKINSAIAPIPLVLLTELRALATSIKKGGSKE